MTSLRRTVLGFLLLKLSVLLVNLVQFPVLRRRDVIDPTSARCADRPGRPDVSLLIPVRNEAENLAAFLPAMLSQDAAEVIVLDDESGDDSVTVAGALLGEDSRCVVVKGEPAPPGWVGKSWACHQLAARASGSVLVFCDADVRLAEGALDDAVTEMQAQAADVFSVFPKQITRSLGEHLIMPLVDDVLLCLLPFALLSIDQPRAATANGSLLAFTRQAYDDVGGFAAVRGELVEDVALARLVRGAGLKLGLALGGDRVGTRMYAGYRAAVTGFGRGLVPVAGGSRAVLVLGWGWHLLAYTVPWPLALRNRAWLIAVILGAGERLLVEAKTGRRQFWQALLVPLSPIATAPVIAQALRTTQTWKGRPYS